jgi:hypothetical protein
MAVERELVARLLAPICLKEATVGRRVGIFVENVPQVDPSSFLEVLRNLSPQRVRLAVLGSKWKPSSRKGEIETTVDPIVANEWRNDLRAREGWRTIYLVLGPAPKLKSLRDSIPILEQTAIRRALAKTYHSVLESENREAFIAAVVHERARISTVQMFDYVAACVGDGQRSKAAIMDSDANELWRLGLLRSEMLLRDASVVAHRRAIRSNLDQIEALARLKSEVKRKLAAIADSDHPLAKDAERILAFAAKRRVRDLFESTLEEIRAALAAELGKEPPQPPVGPDDPTGPGKRPKVRRLRIEGDALAVEEILTGDEARLPRVLHFFDRALSRDQDEEQDEELRIGEHVVIPRIVSGAHMAIELAGRAFTDADWGAVVWAGDSSDPLAALRTAVDGGVDVEINAPHATDGLGALLRKAVDLGIAKSDAYEAFKKHEEARNKLHEFTAALIDHPLLLLAANETALGAVRNALESYQRLVATVATVARALNDEGSAEPARKLVATLLHTDVAFVRYGQSTAAAAGPFHPFHLWRWERCLSVLRSNKAEMRAIGVASTIALVTDPPPISPQLVLSPFAVRRTIDRAAGLIQAGVLAKLPLYNEPNSRDLARLRLRSISRVVERMLRILPHAGAGLRLFLIDPPALSGSIEDLLDQASPLDSDCVVPLHLFVARTRLAPSATEEEEEHLAEISRELLEQGGSIEAEPAVVSQDKIVELARKHRSHLAIAFEPGIGAPFTIGLTSRPALSPFVVPRAFKYDRFDDRLDMVVAGDAEPFISYHELAGQALNLPSNNFLGRRSGAAQSVAFLERLSQAVPWLIVIDQAIEPTLRLRTAQRVDWRSESGRDIATFVSQDGPIEDLAGSVLEQARLVPTEHLRKQLVQELYALNSESILSLARATPGASIADPNRSKGTVGLLSAARWFLARRPGSLVVSLDEPDSQRWILGINDDDRQGDLLAVYQGADGIVIEAIEVKAHEHPESQVRVSGNRASGHAVDQADQSLRAIQQLIGKAPRPALAEARRDFLRTHLYRAVATRPYTAPERALRFAMLDSLFDQGCESLAATVVLVRVDASAPMEPPKEASSLRTPAGHVLTAVQLSETGGGRRSQQATPSSFSSAPKGSPAGKSQSPVSTGGPRPKEGGKTGTATKRTMKVAEPTPIAKPDTAGVAGLRFLVGATSAGDQVVWEPHKQGALLNNFGFLVSGDPGSGKTQILKALIADVAAVNLPVCIFDFKNDYSEKSFAGRHGFTVYNVNRRGLPFNPLDLSADDKGEVQPIRHIHELSSILDRIFGLGDQQEAQLRAALRRAYEDCGIQTDAWQEVSKLPEAPTFPAVVDILEADPRTQSLRNRLSPLFDLGLFPERAEGDQSFENLIAGKSVLDLHELPSDKIKAAISEFMIVRLHGHILKGEQPRTLRRLLVFDEAWRVKGSVRLQELAREGRAFGVGIVIGTQFPGDIPEELAGNIATQLMLYNQTPDHQRTVVKTLCGRGSGPEAQRLQNQIAHLQQHEGFFRNQQYSPYRLVMTKPYFRRESSG